MFCPWFLFWLFLTHIGDGHICGIHDPLNMMMAFFFPKLQLNLKLTCSRIQPILFSMFLSYHAILHGRHQITTCFFILKDSNVYYFGQLLMKCRLRWYVMPLVFILVVSYLHQRNVVYLWDVPPTKHDEFLNGPQVCHVAFLYQGWDKLEFNIWPIQLILFFVFLSYCIISYVRHQITTVFRF